MTFREKEQNVYIPPDYNITFEQLPYILKDRDKILPSALKRNIILIDLTSDSDKTLEELVKLVYSTDSLPMKLGVLCRINGHTTPFCIEKVIYDDDNEEVCIYHTDSVVMDCDQQPLMVNLIKSLSQLSTEEGKRYVKIFSHGFLDPKNEIKRDYKRQSDGYSCPTFSLFDIEFMLENNFLDFAKKYSFPADSENNIYCLTRLPEYLMSTIQSIEGSNDGGEVVRKGLKGIIEDKKLDIDKEFIINGERLTLRTQFSQILESFEQEKDSGRPFNPIIEILIRRYFKVYKETMSQHKEDDLKKEYLLELNENGQPETSEEKKKRKRIGNQVHTLGLYYEENQPELEPKKLNIPKPTVNKYESIITTTLLVAIAILMGYKVEEVINLSKIHSISELGNSIANLLSSKTIEAAPTFTNNTILKRLNDINLSAEDELSDDIEDDTRAMREEGSTEFIPLYISSMGSTLTRSSFSSGSSGSEPEQESCTPGSWVDRATDKGKEKTGCGRG
ncbi:hypothetical protein [endosymbiont of Acanthamoeba sp. UWC8]|uniref:hypothetical protein n=1 Tax=endosymbiont of Acanthamoeba sp. UWC8 TaxID=86106 RepID=UPI0011DD89F1|nr:hypothetical protein [endosymbiont of Acanthamoeba sp. UWC8]